MSIDELKRSVQQNAWFRTGALVATIFVAGMGAAWFFAQESQKLRDEYQAANSNIREILIRLESRVERLSDQQAGIEPLKERLRGMERSQGIMANQVDWLIQQVQRNGR